jgi:hypothetical protein
MPAGDWVGASDLRREVDPRVFDALVALEQQGWRIRRSAHKATLYCPCGSSTIAVPGTAKNQDNAAKRLVREARRCPDRHPNS